jgi:hypothetical protein
MGSPNDAVCPGCQIAGWVAHCTSLVDGDGDRVDLNAIPRAEWAVETLMGCGWIDQSRTYVDNESPDAAWRCPQCGGSGVELVKPDYNEPRSGVA